MVKYKIASTKNEKRLYKQEKTLIEINITEEKLINKKHVYCIIMIYNDINSS